MSEPGMPNFLGRDMGVDAQSTMKRRCPAHLAEGV